MSRACTVHACFVLSAVLLLLLATGCGGGGSGVDRSRVDFTDGAIIEGNFDGAPYRIAVPPAANWNGILLVHARGYRDLATDDIENNNRVAETFPGGIPSEEAFLAQGFALAGSAFRRNGWAVEEGIVDTANLVELFQDKIRTPAATVLVGVSMGSVVALKSAELFPDLYQGVISLCSVGAGATTNFDLSVDFLLAYDVIFGLSEEIGSPGNVIDTVDFDQDLAPEILQRLQSPQGQVALEFIRVLLNIPREGFFENFVLTNFFFATEARAELETRAGGTPVQNLDRVYALPAPVIAQFEALGFPATQVLAGMNAQTVFAADPEAREYLTNFADFSGNHNLPVIMMHNTNDGFVVPGNQQAYINLLSSQGRAGQVFGTYVDSVGHCNFTGQQIGATVAAMVNWLSAGARPSAANFPELLGFDNNFVPLPIP